MVEFLSKLVSFLSPGVLLFGSIWASAKLIESAVSQDFKDKLSDSITNLKIRNKWREWPAQINFMFNRFFSTKHLSWKCLKGSIIVSLVSLSVFMLMHFSNLAEYVQSMIADWKLAGILLLQVIILNAIGDYLSLIETRMLLKKSLRSNFSITFVAFPLADIILSTLIFLFVFNISVISGEILYRGLENKTLLIGQFLRNNSVMLLNNILHPDSGLWIFPVRAFYFTSLVSTFWIWSYFLARTFVEILIRNRKFLKKVVWVLDFKKQPIGSLGVVAGAILFAIHTLISALLGR